MYSKYLCQCQHTITDTTILCSKDFQNDINEISCIIIIKFTNILFCDKNFKLMKYGYFI